MMNFREPQKRLIEKFMFFTQMNQQTAVKCLTINSWNLEKALDEYFQTPDIYRNQSSLQAIEFIFNNYADPKDPSKIKPVGMIKLLDDLGLPPDSRTVSILAWKCDARIQCEFTLNEFLTGLGRLNADNLEKLVKQLRKVELDLEHKSDDFAKLYRFTFEYACENGRNTLDLDTAISYWNILLKDRFPNLNLLCNFFNEISVPKVNKDLWCMVLEFSKTIDNEMTNYDMNDSWPVLLDDFVEWYRNGGKDTAELSLSQ